jgi:hypothetical protein
MQYANDINGNRIEAEPNVKGFCPVCKSDVISKCGDLVIWHFAHKSLQDCDDWYEPESDWHRMWKAKFPVENREVVIGRHRADVQKDNGTVIELQNSHISVATMQEREEFYGNMIWIVNGADFVERFSIGVQDKKTGLFRFNWSHCHKVWSYATKPVLIDLGVYDHISGKNMHSLILINEMDESGYGFCQFDYFPEGLDYFEYQEINSNPNLAEEIEKYKTDGSLKPKNYEFYSRWNFAPEKAYYFGANCPYPELAKEFQAYMERLQKQAEYDRMRQAQRQEDKQIESEPVKPFDPSWHMSAEQAAELERRVLLAGVDLSVLKRISPNQ